MRLPDHGVLIALDLGTARIGVAACDSGHILAYPVEVIPTCVDVGVRVKALIEEYDAVGLIIGYPLTLAGDEGIAAKKISDQAQRLAKQVDIPIWLVDERMSTAEAHRKLRESGRNAKTSRHVVDAQAAVGILESVLYALEQGRSIGQELKTEESHG